MVMVKDKKVLGVCMTKIHDATRSDFLNRLHFLAQKLDYKIIIFNSFVDFYNGNAYDIGARAVYDIINYDIIDALIIGCQSICDTELIQNLIHDARAHHTPVVLINSEAEGCWSIQADYEDAWKQIIRHIVKDHGVTDTFFIAGKKGEKESERRLRYYQEVLEECGVPYEENRVDYGDYWGGPTEKILKRLLSDGKRPPRAIICANDYMAMTVCNILKWHGYSVPEDVIVTGFDGLESAEYFTPQLTTCCEDIETLVRLCLEAVTRAFAGEQSGDRLENRYIPIISESCGCKVLMQQDFRGVSARLFEEVDVMSKHEDFIYSWLDRLMEITDMNKLYAILVNNILENSYVCLRSDFLASILDISNGREMDNSSFTNGLVVISSHFSRGEANTTETMPLASIIPYLDEWIEDDTTSIVTAIHVGSEVCGYYVAKTNKIIDYTYKVKRVLKAINITFNVATNYFRQMKMRIQMEHVELTNSITGMPNLKGAVKWFESFAAEESNHQKTLSVSVYGLPKYTYIYENYGVANVEEALRFVAEALRIANQKDCYLAHISEDEFLVLNYYDDASKIDMTINSATSVFYSVIEGYNTNSGQDYYVEVNAGCTVVNPGWHGALEGFIKFANSEMYMNRLKMGMGSAVKEKTAPKDYYKAFDLLLEKNLFQYHFQPIVSAKTGEIYAYEALMRTDASIGMNPLEVLDAAKAYNRLYEIEKATMFNVLARYEKERQKFGNKKLFVNTIPGYFLKDEDLGRMAQEYGPYIERMVFELTEQDTVSDGELQFIKQLGGGKTKSQLAIDDYGTGHSNIVNLMRYAPQVIKIDRFLISDIHKNQNKQMFVRSTIEFARMNNIKVLAEGVETSNELRMVIDLGVDYVQGYYMARPAYEVIPSIPEEIRQEIIKANPLYGQN